MDFKNLYSFLFRIYKCRNETDFFDAKIVPPTYTIENEYDYLLKFIKFGLKY